jgi:hypothetical protein
MFNHPSCQDGSNDLSNGHERLGQPDDDALLPLAGPLRHEAGKRRPESCTADGRNRIHPEELTHRARKPDGDIAQHRGHKPDLHNPLFTEPFDHPTYQPALHKDAQQPRKSEDVPNFADPDGMPIPLVPAFGKQRETRDKRREGEGEQEPLGEQAREAGILEVAPVFAP